MSTEAEARDLRLDIANHAAGLPMLRGLAALGDPWAADLRDRTEAAITEKQARLTDLSLEAKEVTK